MKILLVLFVAAIPSAFAADLPPVKTDLHFIGKWTATGDCERHPSWPTEITLFKDPASPNVLKAKRGDVITAINTAGEVVEKDYQGITYRTIRLPESFHDGRELVIGSIWKNENDKFTKEHPRGVSVIMNSYRLTDDSTLVFEKFGYSSEETKDSIKVEPYSKEFPRNYHCVFKRSTKN